MKFLKNCWIIQKQIYNGILTFGILQILLFGDYSLPAPVNISKDSTCPFPEVPSIECPSKKGKEIENTTNSLNIEDTCDIAFLLTKNICNVLNLSSIIKNNHLSIPIYEELLKKYDDESETSAIEDISNNLCNESTLKELREILKRNNSNNTKSKELDLLKDEQICRSKCKKLRICAILPDLINFNKKLAKLKVPLFSHSDSSKIEQSKAEVHVSISSESSSVTSNKGNSSSLNLPILVSTKEANTTNVNLQSSIFPTQKPSQIEKEIDVPEDDSIPIPTIPEQISSSSKKSMTSDHIISSNKKNGPNLGFSQVKSDELSNPKESLPVQKLSTPQVNLNKNEFEEVTKNTKLQPSTVLQTDKTSSIPSSFLVSKGIEQETHSRKPISSISPSRNLETNEQIDGDEEKDVPFSKLEKLDTNEADDPGIDEDLQEVQPEEIYPLPIDQQKKKEPENIPVLQKIASKTPNTENIENQEIIPQNHPKNDETNINRKNPFIYPQIYENEEKGVNGGYFNYFIFIIGFLVIGFFLFHHKKRVIALIVEGRRPRANIRSRTRTFGNGNGGIYRKLENNYD